MGFMTSWIFSTMSLLLRFCFIAVLLDSCCANDSACTQLWQHETLRLMHTAKTVHVLASIKYSFKMLAHALVFNSFCVYCNRWLLCPEQENYPDVSMPMIDSSMSWLQAVHSMHCLNLPTTKALGNLPFCICFWPDAVYHKHTYVRSFLLINNNILSKACLAASEGANNILIVMLHVVLNE